jgi:hypothetical protein
MESVYTLGKRIETELQDVYKRLKQLEQYMEDTKQWTSQMAFYKGSDGREVPCVITGAFPKAGTVDIVVFDNRDSGGGRDITGVTLGTERNEVRCILTPEEEPAVEDTSNELVAAKL